MIKILLGVAFAAAFSSLMACNPGTGVGEVSGIVTVRDCDLLNESIELEPDFFTAEETTRGLLIRLQRGSDLQVRSDGVWISVNDVDELYRSSRGAAIPLSTAADTPVTLSLHLNGTCAGDWTDVPVVLQAESGTVVFDEIYAPRVNDESQRIVGRFDNVVVRDPGDPSRRFGRIRGTFDFIYNRGRPAQRYP
jgi:hypothetical protein